MPTRCRCSLPVRLPQRDVRQAEDANRSSNPSRCRSRRRGGRRSTGPGRTRSTVAHPARAPTGNAPTSRSRRPTMCAMHSSADHSCGSGRSGQVRSGLGGELSQRPRASAPAPPPGRRRPAGRADGSDTPSDRRSDRVRRGFCMLRTITPHRSGGYRPRPGDNRSFHLDLIPYRHAGSVDERDRRLELARRLDRAVADRGDTESVRAVEAERSLVVVRRDQPETRAAGSARDVRRRSRAGATRIRALRRSRRW